MRSRTETLRAGFLAFVACAALPFLTGCRQDMHDQPRLKAYAKSAFFADGRAMRPLVPNTVARGRLFEDAHLHQGKVDGKDAETFPMPITKEILARGRERFAIYCINCHGMLGDGDSMIVSRGLKHRARGCYRWRHSQRACRWQPWP